MFPTPNFLKPESKSETTKRNRMFFLGLHEASSWRQNWWYQNWILLHSLCCLKNICLCRCVHSFLLMPNHRNYFLLLFWSLWDCTCHFKLCDCLVVKFTPKTFKMWTEEPFTWSVSLFIDLHSWCFSSASCKSTFHIEI